MLRLHGCQIGHDDAVNLYEALRAEGTAPARETAEAIRWGSRYGISGDLEPDMRAAILKIIDAYGSSRFE